MARGIYRGLEAARSDTAETTTVFHVTGEPEQPLSPIRKLLKGRIRAASKAWRTRKAMAAAREKQSSGEA